MGNTVTIDNVPAGCRLGKVQRITTDRWVNGKHVLEVYIELEPEPKPPVGYELTGEYRSPLGGDYWMTSDGLAFGPLQRGAGLGDPRWILRKIWQSPKWMAEHYKGCWLWKSMTDWWISPGKPEQASDGYFFAAHQIHMKNLAALHGEVFTPPTYTTCLQIERN